jgi:hypothetical protein
MVAWAELKDAANGSEAAAARPAPTTLRRESDIDEATWIDIDDVPFLGRENRGRSCHRELVEGMGPGSGGSRDAGSPGIGAKGKADDAGGSRSKQRLTIGISLAGGAGAVHTAKAGLASGSGAGAIFSACLPRSQAGVLRWEAPTGVVCGAAALVSPAFSRLLALADAGAALAVLAGARLANVEAPEGIRFRLAPPPPVPLPGVHPRFVKRPRHAAKRGPAQRLENLTPGPRGQRQGSGQHRNVLSS